MPFGLTNTSSTSIRVMIQALRLFMGRFMVIYFDDILIYNKTLKHHMDHLSQVCCTLRKKKLYANPNKCVFMTDRVILLRFVVSSQEISADPQKIQAIVEWSESRNIRDVRSFSGLTTFY